MKKRGNKYILIIASILFFNISAHSPEYGYPDHYDYADFNEQVSELAVDGSDFGYGLIKPEYDNY